MKNIIIYILFLLSFFTISCKNYSHQNPALECSEIKITTLDSVKTKRLSTLCKVWGMMRYFHPEIVSDSIAKWDKELFSMMQPILDAKSDKEVNKLLSKWIKKQGEIKNAKEQRHLANDTLVKMSPDFSWIKESTFGKELARNLIQITNANAEYPRVEKYGFIDTRALLQKEEAYKNLPPFPDTGFRLLTLFRYWNAVEYFFPYKYLLDDKWDNVLLKFIPQFINAKDALEYKLILLKLIASITDSHARLSYDSLLFNHFGANVIPVDISFIENCAVVTQKYSNYQNKLEVGDVITEINGKPVADLITAQRPYISASNEAIVFREMALLLLRTNNSKSYISYERAGSTYSDSIETHSLLNLNISDSPKPLYTRLKNNIAYIYLGSEEGGTIPPDINTKGIIIDLRCYPNFGKVKGFLDFPQLYPNQVECVKLTFPQSPGRFVFATAETSYMGENNPNFYKGKKVILVNEMTQSSAEFMSMKYRCAPNSIILGNTTAGTDGDVFQIPLPGGAQAKVTGLGIYYPDGRETQRIGITPDIEVKPTIAGIRSGRDELLERAIKIILTE